MKPTPRPAYDLPKLIDFPLLGNATTGLLTPIRADLMPFEVKTVYWIHGATQATQRGNHAHRHAEQVVFALAGQADFCLEDVRGNVSRFTLQAPHVGLFIPKMYWRHYQLAAHTILLCVASLEYSEEDYIRNYTHFKQYGIEG